MRRRMRARRVTRSSVASSQARIGSGTTGPTITWKGLASHPRSIIPSTNPCLDRPGGFPATGKSFWWNRDDVMGRATLSPRSPARRVSPSMSPRPSASSHCSDSVAVAAVWTHPGNQCADSPAAPKAVVSSQHASMRCRPVDPGPRPPPVQPAGSTTGNAPERFSWRRKRRRLWG
jgi:hypothetical protein